MQCQSRQGSGRVPLGLEGLSGVKIPVILKKLPEMVYGKTKSSLAHRALQRLPFALCGWESASLIAASLFLPVNPVALPQLDPPRSAWLGGGPV